MSDFFDVPARAVKTKTYPTLYARTNTGAIQVWYMEQEGEKYHSVSGQIDGVKTIAAWTIAKGKNVGRTNGTSAVDQATKEIEAKYEKQLKSNGYWEDINDIDKEKFFQVMLAKIFKDYKDSIDWAKGVGVQIKYNGGRIVAKKDGLFSRKGERYISIPHIEEALKPFFLKFPDAVLDGEGFNYELRSKLNEIMKLLRKTVHVTPQDLERSKELIRFYVYDGFGFPANKDGANVSSTACYLERKAAIDNAFFAPCFANRYKDIIGKVPTWIVHSEKELEDLYKKFLDDKQEGAILRILGEGYQNKRTKFLLKYKPVDDAEFKAISVQEGDGKFSGRVSTITYQRIDGGKYLDGTDTFDATFKGTEEEARELWVTGKYEELIDEIHTVQYNGLTGYGKPNYARLDWNNYLNDK
jgi:ATP-dependent DNA ligase